LCAGGLDLKPGYTDTGQLTSPSDVMTGGHWLTDTSSPVNITVSKINSPSAWFVQGGPKKPDLFER